MTQTVKVMVRCRPINKRQQQLNCTIVTEIDQKNNQVNLYQDKNRLDCKSFTFDNVFSSNSLQSQIYEQTAFSLVDNVIQGYNGTIFAYGQTGCGKTFTMMGYNQNQQLKGIIPRTFNHIITFINNQSQKKYLLQCSFIEIYNQSIHDLLNIHNKKKINIKQSSNKGIYVQNLTTNIVKTPIQMQHLMQLGQKNRATRQTSMNKQSSRSHSIFTIYIQSQEFDQLGKQKFKIGKLNLVDLAGSERQSKTHAAGDGIKEAAKINLSLSALGNVISALADGKSHHIPYRDSKLTRLLQDSLGGNTKTIMIAAISPASDNYQQTLSTLRYASRAKFIQNKPVINEDPKDALLRQYAEQIKALKLMLEGRMPLSSQMSIDIVSPIKHKQANHLQNQLNNKQQRLKIQSEQKQKLKLQLQNLQNLISNDVSRADKKQIERMKKLKQKLKIQKKKLQQWKQQRKRHDEQLITVQKNYNSLKQEVEQMRIKFKQLKQKYITNLQELNDIRQTAQKQKQQLLLTIRIQQSQINKYSGICYMMLNKQQIQQIVTQSQYIEQTRQWIIIPFVYKDRCINFPKLIINKNNQYIQQQKNKKQLVIKIGLNRQQSINKFKPIYKISQVVQGARQYFNDVNLFSSNSNINIKKHHKKNNDSGDFNKNTQPLAPIPFDKSGRRQKKYNNNPQEFRGQTMPTINISNSKKIKLKPIPQANDESHCKTTNQFQ